MSKNVSFMSKNVSFMSKNVSFMSKNGSLMSKNVSFMSKNVSLMSKNVSLMSKNVSKNKQKIYHQQASLLFEVITKKVYVPTFRRNSTYQLATHLFGQLLFFIPTAASIAEIKIVVYLICLRT